MADASTRGWGSGWPSCQKGQQVTVSVTGGADFPVHKGIAELVKTLCEATVARGYAIRKKDTWGFNCRPINKGGKPTTTPSNHSWGLAVDINWTTNPQQAPLTTDMPDWMPAMWTDCGFRWGGTYTKTPDTMHYEYMGTPATVAGHLAKARQFLGTPVTMPSVEAAPSAEVLGMPAFPGRVMKEGSEGEDVRTWQARMAERGWRLDPTSHFDARTREVCEKFQTEKGLVVDGKVGRVTWTAAWSEAVT